MLLWHYRPDASGVLWQILYLSQFVNVIGPQRNIVLAILVLLLFGLHVLLQEDVLVTSVVEARQYVFLHVVKRGELRGVPVPGPYCFQCASFELNESDLQGLELYQVGLATVGQ